MLKLSFGIFFLFNVIILLIINHEVKSPYMDEIFHFPQALKYYHGVFTEWDPKITTPPGLYFSTLCLLLPLSGLTGVELNKVQSFRLINLLFSVGNFYILFKILRKYHEGNEMKVYVLSALNLAMFPVLYFFTFLYYTDCGSTFFVLLMYYLHLKHCFLRAAVAGAISLLFRQTNIVWIFYVAAGTTLDLLQVVLYKKQQSAEEAEHQQHEIRFDKIHQPLWREDFSSLLATLLRINAGYILVALAFLKFVWDNGSVALGDKEAHQVGLHLPQLLYFLLFCLAFASPHLLSLSGARDFLRFACAYKARVVEACLICAFALTHLAQEVHPYLLADNRHLTFYVWRRILGRGPYASIALAPLCVYALWSVHAQLRHKNDFFKALLAACVCLATVPQKLLEFRYFILPYIMLRLQFKTSNALVPYLEFLLYTAINYATLYLFLHRTFTWENSEEIQRFMW